MDRISLKIAICDDEYKIQFKIEEFLGEILKTYALQADIECFSSGEEFCHSFERGKFDLIFLDIEYAGMNGVEIGRYIREIMQDEQVQIAYVSSHTGYAMELFEYRPINFLVKPPAEKDIKRVIDKYLLLTKQRTETFQYKVGAEIFQISLADVIYFSSRGRKVTVHKREAEDEFYGVLEQIYTRVKGKRFLYVHKSYIINYNFIRKMEYEQVTLSNGEIIPISQSRRSAIRKQFFDLKKSEIG